MADAPARQQWAVETMAIAPGDRVLEIGCGRGVAVSLISALLTTGTITAIDRSGAMIRLAAQRNADHLASGRATLHTAAIDTADLPPHAFDKIFAVNVSLFWMGAPHREIEAIKRLLAPTGALYVFHETTDTTRAGTVATRTTTTLTRHGFHTTTSHTTSRRGHPMTCVHATTQPVSR